MNLKQRHRTSYYEIMDTDVGKSTIHMNGKPYYVQYVIGQIMSQDVGKRVYERDNVLQVENDEQRDKRLTRAEASWLRQHDHE